MNGTDELREYTEKQVKWMDVSKVHYRKLLAIADRIDAEHQKAMSGAAQLLADAEKDRDYNYANWQDCKQKVLQHNITMDELSTEIERLKDGLLHYIELPKDADGEYIHIGEMVQLVGNDPSTVSHMSLADDGWRVYVKYDNGIGTGSGEPKRIRHYHAPTVEDVLREFALAVCKDEALTIRKDVVDEYAKRLTLAEGEDMSDELDNAKAENAKLRELVSGLEHCSQGFACDCCPLHDPSGTNHRRCESLERELGIEVDE